MNRTRSVYDFRTLHPDAVARLGDPVPIRCTYCQGTKFLQGPQGGLSTNILCVNITCRHWFNHTPYFGLHDLRRQEPIEQMDG